MALLRGLASSTVGRFAFPLLSAGLVAVLVFFAVGCGGEAGEKSGATPGAPAAGTPGAGSNDVAPDGSPEEQETPASTLVTVYSSPTCGCCHEYEKYLKDEGFEVESIRMEDLTEMKEDLGIPSDMQSCHTTMVEEYFVEGHVPVEAIWKLLEEQPEIDGIALPGMPSGSPGMGGDKAEPSMIYSVVEGSVEEFMTL